MNAVTQVAVLASIALADLPEIGSPFAGGFFTGRILVPDGEFAIATAGKEGELEAARWNKNLKRVDGARSFYDCRANTLAMAEAGSVLAKRALEARVGGFDDWAIPSRDIAEMQYRVFKPGRGKNWVYRNGDNPSSFPVGYPYTEDFPAQTEIEAFREGGPEAFPLDYLWTSTQHEAHSACAWIQAFGDGGQDCNHKDNEYRARLVRRVAIR